MGSETCGGAQVSRPNRLSSWWTLPSDPGRNHMSRLHSTLIALVLGSVAAAGLFAGVKTVRLGQTVSAATHPVAARELALRQAKLDRWSRSLRAQQAKRPPALPRVPKFASVSA